MQKTRSDPTVQSLISTSDLSAGSAPAHTTTFTVLRLWPAMHRNVTSANLLQAPRHSTASLQEYCRFLRQHMDSGSRYPTAILCHPSSSICLTAFHLLPSLLAAIFPCKYHFQTFSLTNPQRLLAFLSPLRSICVVTFHKRASSVSLARSKQTATKHTTLADLSLHTTFSLQNPLDSPSLLLWEHCLQLNKEPLNKCSSFQIQRI